MPGYITVKQNGFFEYEDRKSVFIGHAMPVADESSALDFISKIKKKYPDARHHVYAYALRENSIMRFTDDREPQGTAGMPVLDVIRKNGCIDVVIVVVRYFGGTLLGTGGLVRAYTSAALGALKDAQIIKYDVYNEFSVTLTYSDYGKLTSVFESRGVKIIDTVYRDDVSVVSKISKEDFPTVEKDIVECTSGRAKIEILSEKFDY